MAIHYTPYERSSLVDSKAALRNPFLTPLSALARVFDEGEKQAESRDGHSASEHADPRLARIVRNVLGRVHGVVLHTMTTRGVRRAYARAGHKRVHALADIRHLALWEVDEVADGIGTRYVLAAGALGLLAGSLGPRGIAVDAPIVLGLALRCIDDVALHYGFDPRRPSEREFVLDVLASAFGSGKNASFDSLADLATKVHRQWTRQSGRRAGLPLLFTLGRRLMGIMARRRGSRAVPALASTAFGGANAWLLFGVARAAHAAYRERFLRRNASALTP